MPANRVPDGAGGGSRWVPHAPRLDLPGSVWLPNVGYGAPEPEIAGWFERQLKRLTAGNPAQPLLFYCKRDCWMSWNAAKRALALGYQHVFWYPDGTDGWAAAGFALQSATPLPVD
jgi:PQQ-dependent catabolism-associated CXXCW motif protein